MNEKLFAVDVVIVPPEEIKKEAIDLSIKLKGRSFMLAEEDRVPHITLNMGYTGNIEKTIKSVESAISGETPIDLIATGIEANKGATSIKIAKNQGIRSIHYRIMDVADLQNGLKVPKAYFEGSLGIGDNTLEWIKSFNHAHARNNFKPHITIGDGSIDSQHVDIEFPINFRAFNISLFHLGNHNTCRRLLASWELGDHR